MKVKTILSDEFRHTLAEAKRQRTEELTFAEQERLCRKYYKDWLKTFFKEPTEDNAIVLKAARRQYYQALEQLNNYKANGTRTNL